MTLNVQGWSLQRGLMMFVLIDVVGSCFKSEGMYCKNRNGGSNFEVEGWGGVGGDGDGGCGGGGGGCGTLKGGKVGEVMVFDGEGVR